MTRLERWFTARWYGSPQLLWLLLPLEWFYRAVSALRRQYHTQHAERLPVKVVIVGNISVGGTGKTPTLIALCNQLSAAGLSVGVVSRGYGRKTKGVIVVNDQHTAADVGDEPRLIASQAGVPLAVGEDRVEAVKQLCQQHKLQVVLSDDGLQHYRLQRHFELVVIDSEVGLGNGHCLPLGPLREPASRLKQVDAIVLNGNGAGYTSKLGHHQLSLNPMAPTSLFNSDILAPTKVVAVAGIGRPERFFNTLREQGFDVTEAPFSDHHTYTKADLQNYADTPIVMTSKDAVKCRTFTELPLYEVQVSPQVSEQLIQQIINVVTNE